MSDDADVFEQTKLELLDAQAELPAFQRSLIVTLQEGADLDALIAEMRDVPGVLEIEQTPWAKEIHVCKITLEPDRVRQVLEALDTQPAVFTVSLDSEMTIDVSPVPGIAHADLKRLLEQLPSVQRVTQANERKVPRDIGPLIVWVCDDDVHRMCDILARTPGVASARISRRFVS